MQKQSLRIEVVRSHFKHISAMSEQSASDIVDVLRKTYSDVVLTNVDTVADLNALILRNPNFVFAGMYCVSDDKNNGAKVWLADVLERHGIAYTGSGKHANRLSINKHLAKQRMIEQGIKTAAFKLIQKDSTETINEGTLQFPLFVKPTNKSGGQGVDEHSIVYTTEQLQTKVHEIHTLENTDALVEEYLNGREFSVALIGDTHGSFIAMPLELVAAKDSNGDRIRSQVVKTSDSEDMNEISDPIERATIGNFAIDAFHAIGGVGHGRIDIRYNAHNEPHFLEANHIPSLIQKDSSFLKAYMYTIGKNYESMILDIASLGLQKKQSMTRHEKFLPKQ